jgi:hypothetical protein
MWRSMQFVVAAVLILIGGLPARADTILQIPLENQETEILSLVGNPESEILSIGGPFADYGGSPRFTLSFTFTGGVYVGPPITDPNDPGTFHGYYITVEAQGDNPVLAEVQGCQFSQPDSGCGRALTNHPMGAITSSDNITGELIVAGTGTTQGDVTPISNITADIDLPDGFFLTPLPAALPLFATGLGALGLFGWRGRRTFGIYPQLG